MSKNSIPASRVLQVREIIRRIAGSHIDMAVATKYSIMANQLYYEEVKQDRIDNSIHASVAEILATKEMRV